MMEIELQVWRLLAVYRSTQNIQLRGGECVDSEYQGRRGQGEGGMEVEDTLRKVFHEEQGTTLSVNVRTYGKYFGMELFTRRA